MESEGLFTQELWDNIKPVYHQIIGCSYIKRLVDGSLPHSWFAHYLSQDVLYIIDDSRALAITAARAENAEETYFFIQMAKDGLDIERTLQHDFIRDFNIPKATEKSPAFKAHADFLLDHAFNAPYPVAVAALLPCFWVYYKTGEYVFKNAVNDNPYRKWIDTYSGEEYKHFTLKFIRITENLGQKADPGIRIQMLEAFVQGTKHELNVLTEASQIFTNN